MHPSRYLFLLAGAIATASATAHGDHARAHHAHALKRSPPSSVEAAFGSLRGMYDSTVSPSAFADNLVREGLTTVSLSDVKACLAGLLTGEASHENKNTREPSEAVYPSVSAGDAPYDIDEDTLRSAIYIPPGFRYGAAGAKQPVILCGGTGNPGYVSFAGSWIPLLQGDESFGDPVWLNVPANLNDDYQKNAEFVAYAIHYVAGISNNSKVAVFGFSQGNLDAQWAYKYWPSTRAVVSDHVGFSPGYRGSQLVRALLGSAALPAGWLQAEWMSDFVQALISDDGDSAYVPTTLIYSATDQIVQPQTGVNASAVLADVRRVGLTNADVQDVCSGQIAGTWYGHETIMVHPLAYALAKDALANDGPGLLSRIDIDDVCGSYLAPGLGLKDLLLTENTLLYSMATLLLDSSKSKTEPSIKSYARSN